MCLLTLLIRWKRTVRNCQTAAKVVFYNTHELVLLFPGSLDVVAACLDKEVFRELCDPNINKKTTKKRKETHYTPRGNDKASNAQQAAIWTEDQGVRTRGVLIGVHQEAYGQLISEGERMKQSRRQKFNNLRSVDGRDKKIYKKKVKEYYEKIDNKHKFSSDSEDSELDELYEMDSNIEMNKTMQQDSLEELRIAKTSNPKTSNLKKKKAINDLESRTI